MTADEPAENVERPEYSAGGDGPSSDNHLRIHCVFCREVFEGDEIVAARAHIRSCHDIAPRRRREKLMDRIQREKTGGNDERQ